MHSRDFPGLVDSLVSSFPKRKYARGGEVRSEDRTEDERNLNEMQHTGVVPKGFDIRNTWDRASQYYDISGIMRDPTAKPMRKYEDGGETDHESSDSQGYDGGGGGYGGNFEGVSASDQQAGGGIGNGGYYSWDGMGFQGYDANNPNANFGGWGGGTAGIYDNAGNSYGNYNDFMGMSQDQFNGYYNGFNWGNPAAYNPPAAPAPEQVYQDYTPPAAPPEAPAPEQSYGPYDVPEGPVSPPSPEQSFSPYDVSPLSMSYPGQTFDAPQGYGFSNLNPAAAAAAQTMENNYTPESIRDIRAPGYGFSTMNPDEASVPKGGPNFFDTPLGGFAMANDQKRAGLNTFTNDPLSEIVSFPDMQRYAVDRIMEQGQKYGVNISPTGAAAIVSRSLAESPQFGLGHSNLVDEKGRSAYGLNQSRGSRQADMKGYEAANPDVDQFTNQLDYMTKEYVDPMTSIKSGLLGNYERGVAALQSDDPYAADRATIAYERPENYNGWNTPLDQVGAHPEGYRATADKAYNDVRTAMENGNMVRDATSPTASLGAVMPDSAYTPEEQAAMAEKASYSTPNTTSTPLEEQANKYDIPYDQNTRTMVNPQTMNGIPMSEAQGYFSTAGQVSGLPGYGNNLMGLGSSPTTFTGNPPDAFPPEEAPNELTVNKAPAAAPQTVQDVKQLFDPKNVMGPAINMGINMLGPVGLAAYLASYGLTGQSPGYAILSALEKLTGEKGTAGAPDMGTNEGGEGDVGGGGSYSGASAPSSPAASAPAASSPAPEAPAAESNLSPATASFGRERNAAPDYEHYGFNPEHSFFR